MKFWVSRAGVPKRAQAKPSPARTKGSEKTFHSLRIWTSNGSEKSAKEAWQIRKTVAPSPHSSCKTKHKHNLSVVWMLLGTTPRLSQGQTQFVLGTNPGFLSLFYRLSLLILHIVVLSGSHLLCSWDKVGSKGGRNSVYSGSCASFALPTVK